MPSRILVCVLAAAVAALSASPAAGAPSKPFTMNVAPAHEWAGVTDDAYTVTLINDTKTQQLGSADVTVPAAITIVDRNGIPGAGNVLELRNLELPPGGSATVTVGLRMPCVSGVYAWAVRAKQSNDFSGTPGNDLGPVSGTRSTTVDGSCALRFADEPASAEENAQIRADAFQPASTHLVTVEAIDGSPAPQRLDWFEGTIDLRLVQTGPGELTPNPASSPAVAGSASFSNLSIDESGNYSLRATTTSPGFGGDDSAGFQIIGVVEDCNSSGCRAQLAGRQTSISLTGTSVIGAGFALVSLDLGPRPVCAGYTGASDDYYEFQLKGANGDMTVLQTFTKAAMKSFKGGPSALEICFAAQEDFEAKTGPAAPFDFDGDGDDTDGFAGLLPDCPTTPPGPCILDRGPMGSGGAQVSYFVPAFWSDPRGWG